MRARLVRILVKLNRHFLQHYYSGMDFSHEDGAGCSTVLCDDSCNKQCTEYPEQYNDCKCVSTGWGEECLKCSTGKSF